MHRVGKQRHAEAIAQAFELIPQGILKRIQDTDFLVGIDPFFAGLFDSGDSDDIGDGRSYRDTACVHYAHLQTFPYRASQSIPACRRRTTVVLPTDEYHLSRPVIVHELGHVFHELMQWMYVDRAVSEYGKSDPYERWAEAFTSWLIPGYAERPDDRAIALFESIAYDLV